MPPTTRSPDDLSSVTDSFLLEQEGGDVELSAATIYGRKAEMKILLDTYQRVILEKTCLTVVVHGESGSGKTALVETLREPVAGSDDQQQGGCQGYFCASKYFQNSSVQEPYSAIMAVFSDLCDLVLQSEDVAERRAEIQKELGISDGIVLSKAITGMSSLLKKDDVGAQDDDDAIMSKMETRNESIMFATFRAACKNFLRAVSTEKHPVVLFLDDVQWMDEGSRSLLETFLQDDAELKFTLFVLSYRDEELGMVKSFLGSILHDDVNAREHPSIVDLPVKNLDSEGVNEMISAAMKSSSPLEIRALSDLISIKTYGNPFHVIEFFEAIFNEGLLQYEDSTSTFVYDVDEIQREMMVSDSLAALLSRKISRLSLTVQVTLKIASVLGYRFSERLLFDVLPAILRDRDAKDSDVEGDYESNYLGAMWKSLHKYLSAAVAGRFMERTRDGFQFSHDKLQSAFLSMLEEGEETRLHRRIGEQLLTFGENPEYLYQAAVHLNQVPQHDRSELQRIDLARCNLEASKFCKEKSAFEDAAAFLETGIALIPTRDKWTTHFDLSFELTESLARIQLINGKLDECKVTTGEALRRGKSVEMKMDSLLLDVEARMAGNQMDDTVAAATRALKALGVTLPRKVGNANVIFMLLSVRRKVRNKSDDDILNLPEMTDRTMATAIRLLLHISFFLNLKDEGLWASYTSMLAMRLTLEHGASPHSSGAFAVYGVTEIMFGNYQRGCRFGRLARQMLDQVKCIEAECPTIVFETMMLAHWTTPLDDLVKEFDQATRAGFATGDVVYGFFCVSLVVSLRLIIGDHMESIEDDLSKIFRHTRDLADDTTIMWCQPGYQFILNMQSHSTSWRDLTNLTGEVMNETIFLRNAMQMNAPVLLVGLWVYKALVAYHFGFTVMAEGYFKELSAIGQVYVYTMSAPNIYGYATLTSYQRYRESGKRKHLKNARRYKKLLLNAQSVGSPNVAANLLLLSAEELSLERNASLVAVKSAYDTAIDAAAVHNWSGSLEALANERAAFVLLNNMENATEAVPYFRRAIELYAYEWGATAKSEWLLEKSRLSEGRRQNNEEEELGLTPLVGEVITIEDGAG